MARIRKHGLPDVHRSILEITGDHESAEAQLAFSLLSRNHHYRYRSKSSYRIYRQRHCPDAQEFGALSSLHANASLVSDAEQRNSHQHSCGAKQCARHDKVVAVSMIKAHVSRAIRRIARILGKDDRAMYSHLLPFVRSSQIDSDRSNRPTTARCSIGFARTSDTRDIDTSL